MPRRAKSTQRRRPRLLSCFSGRILNIVCVCAAQTQLRCVLSSFASSEQMNSREESLRSTFLITLLFILILHYFTNFGMIPSTSPSQYVFMDQCWFCVCPSKVYVCVCVSVCPFYNTWIVFVQALQPPPAHPAPAGDISTGSKATTSHAGYKAVRKSSTTNPFQLCYVKTQVLLLTNVAHVIVRFCTFQLI